MRRRHAILLLLPACLAGCGGQLPSSTAQPTTPASSAGNVRVIAIPHSSDNVRSLLTAEQVARACGGRPVLSSTALVTESSQEESSISDRLVVICSPHE